MELLLATNNPHKRRELAAILSSHSLVLPREVGVEFEFEETESTFHGNSIGKALALHELAAHRNVPVVADDSGLCVPALDGEPGVYSARYGSSDGRTKLTDGERNQYLLRKMSGIDDRRAYYVCAMVVVFQRDRFYLVQETWHGRITREPRGDGGFGYDPVFELPESGLTVAEIAEAEKNRASHRGKAAARLASLLD